MNYSFDSFEIRSINILRLLYSEDRWWRENELSQLISCSPETTYKIIKHLNLFFDANMKGYYIVTQPNRGIHLNTSVKDSIGKVEALYVKKTLSFILIDTIFHSSINNVDDLAEYLHISSSTAYRKLQLLKKYLNNHNLTLNIQRLEITGPEINVREFYYQLYWSVIKSDTWPFELSSDTDYRKNLLSLLNTKDFYLSSIEKLQFLYRLVIGNKRIEHGHYLNYDLNVLFVDSYHEKYAHELVSFLDSNLPNEFLGFESRLLAFNLVSNPMFKDNSKDYVLKLDWHKQNHTLPFMFSQNLLLDITKVYSKLDFREPNKILYKLIRSTTKALILHNFQMTNHTISSFNQQFSQENTSLFDNIHNVFKEHIELILPLYPKIDQPYLLYNILLVFTRALELNSVKKTISIKLNCNVEPAREFYLEQQLKNNSHLNLDIHTSLTANTGKRHYDLLLTDFNICQNCKIQSSYQYSWDFPPCMRDWNNIYTIINQIEEDYLNLDNSQDFGRL